MARVKNPANYVGDYSFLGDIGKIVGGMVKDYPQMAAFDRQIAENDNFNNDLYDSMYSIYEKALEDDKGAREALSTKFGIPSESPELDKAVLGSLKRSGEREDKNKYMGSIVNQATEVLGGSYASLGYLGQAAAKGYSTEQSRQAIKDGLTKHGRKMFFEQADAGKFKTKKDFYAGAEMGGMRGKDVAEDPRFSGYVNDIENKSINNAITVGMAEAKRSGGTLAAGYKAAIANLEDSQDEAQVNRVKETFAMMAEANKVMSGTSKATLDRQLDALQKSIDSLQNEQRYWEAIAGNEKSDLTERKLAGDQVKNITKTIDKQHSKKSELVHMNATSGDTFAFGSYDEQGNLIGGDAPDTDPSGQQLPTSNEIDESVKKGETVVVMEEVAETEAGLSGKIGDWFRPGAPAEANAREKALTDKGYIVIDVDGQRVAGKYNAGSKSFEGEFFVDENFNPIFGEEAQVEDDLDAMLFD